MSKISITYLIEQYEKKCGKFSVEHDKDTNETYIYTERFFSEPIYTDKKEFADFSDKIKDLFKVTFSDPTMMEKYEDGEVYTEQEYESMIPKMSFRYSHGHPFIAFIATENNTDKVVGYHGMNSCFDDKGHGISNTAQVAYIFNKKLYPQKYVGYENTGALILGYAKELAENKVYVNQSFDKEIEKYIGGTVFTTLSATARTDNGASIAILKNLGFNQEPEVINNRYEFKLNYNDILTDVSLSGTGVITEIY